MLRRRSKHKKNLLNCLFLISLIHVFYIGKCICLSRNLSNSYTNYSHDLVTKVQLKATINQTKPTKFVKTKKPIKQFDSFKMNLHDKNTSWNDFNTDYKENFVKLIENFLLEHIKKVIDNDKYQFSANNSEQMIYKILDSYDRNSSTKAYSTSTYAISKNVTIFSVANRSLNTFPNKSNISESYKLHRSNISDLNHYQKELIQLRNNFYFYKNYHFYFVMLVGLLSTTSLTLLIITFVSCIINCKQRSQLNYYNENEFFTYYNKNLPIIASVSSFSLATSPNVLDNFFNSNGNKAMTNVNSTSSMMFCEPLINSSTSNMDYHKLSTHFWGNKSSLKLYNQCPNPKQANTQVSFPILDVPQVQTSISTQFNQSQVFKPIKTETNNNKFRFPPMGIDCQKEKLIQLNPVLFKKDQCVQLQNQHLGQTNFSNFQEGSIPNSITTENNCNTNNLTDDEDLVFEAELSEKYDKCMLFSTLDRSIRTGFSDLSNTNDSEATNLPKIKFESGDLMREENLDYAKRSESQCSRNSNRSQDKSEKKITSSTNEKENSESKSEKDLVETSNSASSNFIRDRYYQILREQVFPFLQKPRQKLNNEATSSNTINESIKDIQDYNNDVLY